jgi:hypothetical protein
MVSAHSSSDKTPEITALPTSSSASAATMGYFFNTAMLPLVAVHQLQQ